MQIAKKWIVHMQNNHCLAYFSNVNILISRQSKSLRYCETSLALTNSSSVGIKNCKQLLSRVEACSIKRKALSAADIISTGDETFLSTIHISNRWKKLVTVFISGAEISKKISYDKGNKFSPKYILKCWEE